MKFPFTYLKTFRINKKKNVLNKKANVLYLTRNALLEPLGQSQVMAYLRGLSEYILSQLSAMKNLKIYLIMN